MSTTEAASAWTKLPPIEAHYGGCLNCGPRPAQFPPEGVVAVGFGYAALHKDGEAVWTEGETVADNSMMTGADAEAHEHPEHRHRDVEDHGIDDVRHEPQPETAVRLHATAPFTSSVAKTRTGPRRKRHEPDCAHRPRRAGGPG